MITYQYIWQKEKDVFWYWPITIPISHLSRQVDLGDYVILIWKVRKQFLHLSMLVRPDKNGLPGAAEALEILEMAEDALDTAEKRRNYLPAKPQREVKNAPFSRKNLHL